MKQFGFLMLFYCVGLSAQATDSIAWSEPDSDMIYIDSTSISVPTQTKDLHLYMQLGLNNSSLISSPYFENHSTNLSIGLGAAYNYNGFLFDIGMNYVALGGSRQDVLLLDHDKNDKTPPKIEEGNYTLKNFYLFMPVSFGYEFTNWFYARIGGALSFFLENDSEIKYLPSFQTTSANFEQFKRHPYNIAELKENPEKMDYGLYSTLGVNLHYGIQLELNYYRGLTKPYASHEMLYQSWALSVRYLFI